MRISNNMLSRNLLLNLWAAQGRMDKLQNQMSTGQKINRPSDDPVGAENSLRFKSNISYLNQLKANAKEGIAYMDTTDDTMAEMTEMIQRAKELALRASNTGTVSDEDRKKIAIEIDQIREHVIELANTKVGTKYIFGGTANVEPFPKGATGWQGSDDTKKFQVGGDLSIEVSVNGHDLFGAGWEYVEKTPSTDPPTYEYQETGASGIAMFDTLAQLSKALNESNINGVDDGTGTEEDGVQVLLSKLELQADHISDVRAQLGARQNRMDSVYTQLDSTAANLGDSLATVLYADIAETLVNFKTQESIYEAALAVGTKIIQPSLADFMR
ncbi:flagellar hook-associated protein FlgL [Desulfitobacterium chlororespirans]|uniref:Flagellar hook-associated protein 3 FlgL n=1 Tax=Desulfitobacterium chlororespirans DSM 11544 TaxID=1121395 RepID=A0A1M7UD80_9FIRM|nr:flagellar hook-associated protein FlgL [Desulfitobacterium chlororespirans]SHN80916.1 flagellar hook-associated protein 3 FlgL [Desulfitobacterium chlororespirans DSM 11544]